MITRASKNKERPMELSPKIYGARAVQGTWTPSLASDGHVSEYPTFQELPSCCGAYSTISPRV